MSPTVLVTGATGKTGRRLIPKLVARGVAVRAASRIPAPADAGVEPVHFDWSNEGTYKAARTGVDAIYLVAGGPADAAEQVRALLDGAVDGGVARVVLLSALGVDQAPEQDPLRRVELAVQASGIPATVLRPGAFMQNFSEPHWSRLDEGIRDRDEIMMPGGDAAVSWVSTEDIAATAAVALTEDSHGGKGYTVTGAHTLTMPEVAAHISRATGRRITYVESDQEQLHAALIAQGAPTGFAEYASRLYTVAITSGAFGVITDDVAAVTGRPPMTFAQYAAGALHAWHR